MRAKEFITEDWRDDFVNAGASLYHRIVGGNNNFQVTLPTSTRGNDVKSMQLALQALGYTVGPPGIDGIIGPYTKSAIKKFQLDNSIKTNTPEQPSQEMVALLNKQIGEKGLSQKLAAVSTKLSGADSNKFVPPKGGKLPSALSEPEFLPALEKVAANLGVPSKALLGIMKLESRLSPQAVNPTTTATGLIQFMPKTARSLGTSVQELFNMSGTQQLPYVEKYLKGAGVKPGMNIGDIYLAVFYPAALGKADDHVISTAGKQVYNQNKGLDASKDGVLTVADVKQSANRFA